MAEKTIADYQADYQAAKAAGDAAGMQAANDGANAIRTANGQAEQKATQDIKDTAYAAAQNSGTSTTNSGTSATNSGTSTTNSGTSTTNSGTSVSGYGTGDTSTGGGATSGGAGKSYTATSPTYGTISVHYDSNGNIDYFTVAGDDTPHAKSELDNGTVIQTQGGNFAYTGAQIQPTVQQKTQETQTAQATTDYDLATAQELYNQQKAALDQWQTAANQQAQAQIDYATQTGVEDYNRTLQEAQATYANNLAQIEAQKQNDLDNAALYAEARGDKGGIGAAQYNEVMNTAAINEQTVKSEQTKLTTDISQEIAALRAQGEYDKADKVLEISQSYLTQLMSIQQYAAEYGLSVAQFQESIREFEENLAESIREFDANFSLSEAGITGYYNGQATLANSTAQQETLSNAGYALLSSGVLPSDEQLAAMGMTAQQAQAYIVSAQAAATASGSDTGGGDGDGAEEAATMSSQLANFESLVANQQITSYQSAYAYLSDAGWSDKQITNTIGDKDNWTNYASGVKAGAAAETGYQNSVKEVISAIETPLSNAISNLLTQNRTDNQGWNADDIVSKAISIATNYAIGKGYNELLISDAINNIDWDALKEQINAQLK